MGTSNWDNVTYCIEMLRKIKPKTVLDIGVGYGRWGMVCREFLDVWDGNVLRDNWKLEIDGVEVFAGNIDEYHKYFYDNIYIMDAKEYISSCKKQYDLVILGDVLEHFSKLDGLNIIKCLSKIGKYIMINVPLGEDWEQDEIYGNIHERHLSTWLEYEFEIYRIVRKKVIRDHLGREYATIIIQSDEDIYCKLLHPYNIEEESKQAINCIKDEQYYVEILEDMKNKRIIELKNIIDRDEQLIMNAGLDDKRKIQIQVVEGNSHSSGTEVWIHHIKSNNIQILDLMKVQKDNLWQIIHSSESPTNKCLLSSTPTSKIEFEIIGEELELLCLSHPWSGKFEVIVDGKSKQIVDLFSNINKMVTIKIKLKDE